MEKIKINIPTVIGIKFDKNSCKWIPNYDQPVLEWHEYLTEKECEEIVLEQLLSIAVEEQVDRDFEITCLQLEEKIISVKHVDDSMDHSYDMTYDIDSETGKITLKAV